MGCCGKKEFNLDEGHKAVLKAIGSSDKPIGTKDIIAATGMDEKVIAAKMKGLKDNGYIESPVRCKYCLTDSGRKSL
ncbi:MAG: hypothetical protein Kow00107_07120 [Planctomycetota bacterium]